MGHGEGVPPAPKSTLPRHQLQGEGLTGYSGAWRRCPATLPFPNCSLGSMSQLAPLEYSLHPAPRVTRPLYVSAVMGSLNGSWENLEAKPCPMVGPEATSSTPVISRALPRTQHLPACLLSLFLALAHC